MLICIIVPGMPFLVTAACNIDFDTSEYLQDFTAIRHQDAKNRDIKVL